MADLLELPQIERLGADTLRHAPPELELEPALAREAIRPWPIARTCSTRYTARRQSGRRRIAAIELIVVHCTQGSTARGAAAWFANEASRGSAHLVVDELECYRTLPPSVIPWGAPNANGRGWHIELAGFAQWSTEEWMARRGTLERAAYKVALHAKAFGIPVVKLSDRQLAAGAQGITSHRQCSRIYGGTHWDPGFHFPWAWWMRRVKYHRARLST